GPPGRNARQAGAARNVYDRLSVPPLARVRPGDRRATLPQRRADRHLRAFQRNRNRAPEPGAGEELPRLPRPHRRCARAAAAGARAAHLRALRRQRSRCAGSPGYAGRRAARGGRKGPGRVRNRAPAGGDRRAARLARDPRSATGQLRRLERPPGAVGTGGAVRVLGGRMPPRARARALSGRRPAARLGPDQESAGHRHAGRIARPAGRSPSALGTMGRRAMGPARSNARYDRQLDVVGNDRVRRNPADARDVGESPRQPLAALPAADAGHAVAARRLGMVRASQLPNSPGALVAVEAERARANGVVPDLGFATAGALDLRKELFPFGEKQKPYDTLSLASLEAFSKDRTANDAPESANVHL